MTTTAIQTVAVGDDTLEAIQTDDGAVWVTVRRVCAALGIDVDTQRKKLIKLEWARGKLHVMSVVDALGRPQDTLAIELDALPMWLTTIEPHRVSGDVRAKLVRFQIEARAALARHFGMEGSLNLPSRGSGGGFTSGAPSAATRQMLTSLQAMTSMLATTISELDTVRADGQQTRAYVLDTTAQMNSQLHEVRKTAEDAAAIADRAARAGVQARESRRRLDTAVAVITTAIRRFCTEKGHPYQRIYSEVRADLGLRRTQEGGPALGKAKLRADQVLRLSRTATRMGVPGVGAVVIEAILNGEDDPTRPGAIDAEVTSMTRVAARSAERSTP